MKAVELLYKAAVAGNTLTKPVPMISGGGGEGGAQPATLFSTGIVRGEFACNVS